MPDKERSIEISTKSVGPVTVIHITGELDVIGGPQLEELARKTLEQGARRCIVDLTRATFIDSIGVGSLIRTHRAAVDKNSALAVAGAQGMIAQLIKITQLHRIFKVYATLDEALASAQQEVGTGSAR
jgi:anti-sigma B factor antagonist